MKNYSKFCIGSMLFISVIFCASCGNGNGNSTGAVDNTAQSPVNENNGTQGQSQNQVQESATVESNAQEAQTQQKTVAPFRNMYDVDAYTLGRTFVDDSGVHLVIKQDGFYANGTCLSAAPTVEDFGSSSATIVAQVPGGRGTIRLYLSIENGVGTLVEASSGDTYTAQ